jgi:hypothetical protein
MSTILETEYEITPSNLVKGLTLFVFILFIVIGAITPTSIYYLENDITAAFLILILDISIFIPILIGAWAYSPTKYLVSNESIKILRPIGPVIIQLNEILRIEEKQIETFKTIRLIGNGGLFSFTGSFYNKPDGKFWMYAKNNNFVMITTKEKKSVLSPDEKEQFIIEIKNKIARYEKESRKK